MNRTAAPATLRIGMRPVWILCLLFAAGCGPAALDKPAGDEMVRYSGTTRIRGFDPVKASDVASSMAISKIYEGLLQYAYLERPYRVEPLLAESMPDVSDDGTVYTFPLRHGIYFRDDPCFEAAGGRGRELVARDFVYSIMRNADLKNESNGFWAFNDRIVGLDAWRATTADPDAPSDYDAQVLGLRAIDPYTFQIRLKRPYPQLLWVLAIHYAVAVPREAVEYYGEDFVNHPVGTGPYMLESWRKNYRLEYVRNPKWEETGRVETYPTRGEPQDREAGLLADAGKSIPFIDRIVQYVIQDFSTRWLMFLAGQLDTLGTIEVTRDNWDAVIVGGTDLTDDLVDRGIRLSTSPTMILYYIGFNMDDPILGKNITLRQALTSAMNTAEWIELYNHRILRPTSPIPPGVAGHSDTPPPFPFDLDRARRLLAEAGYPDGIDPETGRRLRLALELGSAENPEMRQSAELFVSFMDRIGVVVEPSYNNWPVFLDKLDRRQVQLYRLAWVADYPDAENFLQLFYSPNQSPGPNHSNYSDDQFDALYERARVMKDSPERTALYEKMAALVNADCAWILDGVSIDFTLNQPWVRNDKYHAFPYGMDKYRRTLDRGLATTQAKAPE